MSEKVIARMLVTDSKNVVSFGYDSESKILEIEYIGGSIYQYFDVPEELFFELSAASSKGKFIHANIKDKFTCVKTFKKEVVANDN